MHAVRPSSFISLPLFRLLAAMAFVVVAFESPKSFAESVENRCESVFKPMGWAKTLVNDYREVGPGRLLFRPTDEVLQEKAFGLLTKRTNYYENIGTKAERKAAVEAAASVSMKAMFKTSLKIKFKTVVGAVKRGWQFVPSRVVGAFRGEEGRLHGLIYGDPTYVVTFGAAIQYTLLDKPIHSMSELLKLKRRYVSSLVLSLATLGGGSAYLHTQYIDPAIKAHNVRVVVEAAEKTTAEHRQELMQALRYDVRDRDLRELWVRKVPEAKTEMERRLIQAEILETALYRSVSNDSFFEKFKPENLENFEVTRESITTLVKRPHFAHLSDYAPAEIGAPLDQKVLKIWRSLIYLNWTYQVLTELAPSFIVDSEQLKQSLKDPSVRSAAETMFSSSFAVQVRELYRQKRLSKDEASSLIGLSLYYRTRFAESRLLNGGPDEVSMADIERELLETAVSGRARWDLP